MSADLKIPLKECDFSDPLPEMIFDLLNMFFFEARPCSAYLIRPEERASQPPLEGLRFRAGFVCCDGPGITA